MSKLCQKKYCVQQALLEGRAVFSLDMCVFVCVRVCMCMRQDGGGEEGKKRVERERERERLLVPPQFPLTHSTSVSWTHS